MMTGKPLQIFYPIKMCEQTVHVTDHHMISLAYKTCSFLFAESDLSHTVCYAIASMLM